MFDFNMQKPSINIINDPNDQFHKTFVIEPLERGYGTTVGNSLRRIMLSSLPGGAATAIQIEGVSHEFQTIDGVLEDVTSIVLAIKNLVLRIDSDEEKQMLIDVTGKTEVTAADIQHDADVTIINPDLHIATLSSNDVNFKMRINARRGRGYVSSEENKESDVIGIIPVDSIFTPVLKVSPPLLEETRVGRMTNFDKLTLDVWTKGSLLPEEAISLASKVLVEHLNIFMNLEEEILEGVSVLEEQQVQEEVDQKLSIPIEELDISVRSYNCLKRSGIDTLSDLIDKTEQEIKELRNLGRKSFEELKEKVAERGLHFKSRF